MFLQISGDKDEEQLLIAGKHYLNRPGFLESILNDLYIGWSEKHLWIAATLVNSDSPDPPQ